jgi:small-conductance mechanosensitive channel
VLDDPEPLAIFVGFGESSLDFELRCWIPRFEEGLVIETALRVGICARLRAAGIEIPFPQRDLHLRSVAGAAHEAAPPAAPPAPGEEPDAQV